MLNQGGNLADDRRQIFLNWSEQKIRLEGLPDPLFYFYEREIWWASLGKNIGHEMDGKKKISHSSLSLNYTGKLWLFLLNNRGRSARKDFLKK